MATKLTGEIVSVDVTAKTITVKDQSGKSETYNSDVRVTIKKVGKTITLAELAAGNKVTLYYITAAGKKIATSIYVL